MKARKNPTFKQMMRRFRRHPARNDPRFEFDSYWVLRSKGYSHSYAKRAHRDKLPKVIYVKSDDDAHYEIDPKDDLSELIAPDPLCPPGDFKEIEVDVRPLLTREVIAVLDPRQSEYTVWDNRIIGFGVRIRPSGHKTFILLCRVRDQKRLRKITIGRADWIDFDTARTIAQDLLMAARMGREPLGDFKGLGAYRHVNPSPRRATVDEPPILILTDEAQAEEKDEED